LQSGATCTHIPEANTIGPYTNLVEQKEDGSVFQEPTNQLLVVEFQSCDNDQGTETSSKSSVISSVKDHYELYFSIPSNLLFLFGSICYTILSILDLEWESNDDSAQDDVTNDDGQEEEEEDTSGYLSTVFSFYVYISLIGASLFVLNALVDMSQCFFLQKSNFKKAFCHQEFLACASSALLFGCAAMLDLMNSISVNVFSRYGDDAGYMNIVSAHLYLMSAICAMMNTNTISIYSGTHEMLNVAGDIMFMVGSLIDVIISYISDPDIVASNQHILLRLGMLSSVLWVIDALFYLVADIFFWKVHYVGYNEGGEDEEVPSGQLPLLVVQGDVSYDGHGQVMNMGDTV
jgi:hypothetical protein